MLLVPPPVLLLLLCRAANAPNDLCQVGFLLPLLCPLVLDCWGRRELTSLEFIDGKCAVMTSLELSRNAHGLVRGHRY